MASSLSPEHRARLADIVARMEGAGEPPENIQTAVDGYKAKYSAEQGGAAPQSGRGVPPMTQAVLGGFMGALPGGTPGVNRSDPRRILSALPGAGGAIGGLAGGGEGPVSIGGAAIGGGALEGVRQGLSGEMIDPARIGLAAGEQGATQAAGGLLAKGASKLARPIMKGAIRASKAIQREFPNVVETALQNFLTVSKGGLKKAEGLRKESAKATGKLISGAEKAGARFPSHKVVEPVYEALGNRALPDRDAAVMMNEIDDFLLQHPGEIDPTLLQEIKQIYAQRAVPGYAADAAGKKAAAQSPLGQFNKGIAAGARKQLGTIPGVTAQDATTQELIGAERAIRDAMMRPARPFEIQKPGTYAGALMLDNPMITSNIAVRLADPGFQAFIRQNPRGAAALIQQLTHADQPDATNQNFLLR